jgi:DNA polymerase III subunit beta
MHITLSRDDLLKPLSIVTGVVERRQTLPILSNILLRHNGKSLTLTGTDLEVEISTNAACQGAAGEMTLPARKLYDICRALPAGAQVEIQSDKDKATLKSGKSRFKLLAMPANEFPAIETSSWEHSFEIKQNRLRWLLEKTSFCMAQQDVRYYLNGLLFETGPKKLRTVATDGHRLSMAEVELDGDTATHQVILPRKGVQEMMRFLGETDDTAKIQVGANHLRLTIQDVTFTSKLIDSRFPDYNKVIPAGQNRKATINRELFKETLSRVSILSNEKYRGVRFGLAKGNMSVTAHNPEQEEAQEDIVVDYNNEEMEIGFNVSYIIEAVNSLESEQIEFGLNDPNSSCVLRTPGNGSYLYVVMPMRL